MELGVAIDSLNQDPYLFIFEVRNTSLAREPGSHVFRLIEALFFFGPVLFAATPCLGSFEGRCEAFFVHRCV